MIDFQDSTLGLVLSELLITMAVGGTILAAVVFLCRSVFRTSASIRFAILRMLFCGWMALPVLALTLPEIPLGLKFDRKSIQPAKNTASEVGYQIAEKPRSDFDPVSEPSAGDRESPLASGTVPPIQRRLAPIRVQESSVSRFKGRPIESRESRGEKSATAGVRQGWVPVFWLVGWGIGVVVVLLRHLIEWKRIHKVIASAIPVEASEIAWRAGMEVHELSKVEFYLSNQFMAPVTTGIRHPIVLLSGNSLGLKRDVLRMVILHEMAHVKRRDVFWQVVFSLTTALYWFHPIVWNANRIAKRERELACDDWVLANGTQPETYASVLLDHAAAATGRPVQWGAAIPMARGPLQYRIKAILDESTCRRHLSRRFAFMVVMAMTVLVFATGAVRPFQEKKSSVEEVVDKAVDETVDVRFPKLLSGKIVDEQGQPLEGVKIELHFTTWADDEQAFVSRRTDHKKWKLVTDRQGVYTADTAGLDASKIRMDVHRLNFIGWASLDGRVTQPINQSGKYVVEKGGFKPVGLPSGRLITGRVVPPADTVDQEILNPRVRVAGPNYWTSRPIRCGADGEFSLYVPQVGEIEVLAFADNFAATRVFAGKDGRLGNIELKQGTRIKGQVLDTDGRPVSGVVVAIRNDRFNEISQLHRNGRLLPHAAVKTEMDGWFQFPPLRGPSTVCVVNESRSHDANSNFLNLWADQKPPIVLPKSIDLDGSVESLELTLQECETVTVSGTVRWPDGTGASGLELRGSVMAGGQGVVLDHAKTNSRGEYQLRFPAGSEFASVLCFGTSDENAVWHDANPVNELDARQKSRQMLGLRTLSENVAGADWKLVKRKDRVRATRTSAKTRNSESALAEFASRYYRTPAEDRDHAALIPELLELEKTYRGETAALNALRLVMGWTSYSTNANSKKLCHQVVRRLRQHYLTHPDLDSVMSELPYQFELEPSVEFLNLVEKRSPHSQVQASALLYQLQFLAKQVDARDTLEQKKWSVEELEKFPLEYQREVQQLAADLKELDPVAMQKRIEGVSKRLKSKFGDLNRQSFVSNIQSFRLHRYAPDDMQKFGELADQIMFRVTRLRPGKMIEDFEGTDADGKNFRLSDYRGKVVMLMFSADWCRPCKEMYPENRDLVSAFQGRPFQLISVMGDQKPETVAAAIGAGDITWRTTWDGKNGPIATKWNIDSWPTVFVIDHLGVIRSTGMDSKTRRSLIESLVKQAEDQ